LLPKIFHIKFDENELILFEQLHKYAQGIEKTFFTHMFYCIQADQYEWCHEFDHSYNPFYKQDNHWNENHQHIFFKWVGTYYLLTFYKDLKTEVQKKQMEATFFLTLSFEKKERITFYHLKHLHENQDPFFELKIGKYLLKELLYLENPTIQQVTITCHFLQSGYAIFLKLLERYYSLDSLISC